MTGHEHDETESDPLADRNLIRFTLREIILLQVVAAAMFWFDFVVVGFAISIVFFPLVLTTWAAYRLRNVAFLTLVNPFTIGIASNYVFFLVLFILQHSIASQGPAALYAGDMEEDRWMLLWGPPIIGCMEGFFALFLAKVVAGFTDR